MAPMVLHCVYKARWELKLVVVFAFLVFAASLRNPMASRDVPQWQVLAEAQGVRYWFLPTLGFAWTLVWCATSSRNAVARTTAVLGLLAMIVGITADWRHPAYADLRFPLYAGYFEAAAPGAFLTIPIHPPGWTMRITKKVQTCRTLPFGYLDLPAPGARVGGPTPFGGWVMAYEPIQHVSVHIDGRAIQLLELNFPRPDVDAIYPRSPVKLKGYIGIVDLSGLPSGMHQVEARAIEAGGCEAAFSTVIIRKAE